MNARDRYHIDEAGKVWFAVECSEGYTSWQNWGRWITFGNHRAWMNDVRFSPLYRTDENGNEVPNIEITDALACSRAELGPVYVVEQTPDGRALTQPWALTAVTPGGGVRGYTMRPGHSSTGALLSLCRVANPDELKEAGLWE
jgi:hypothetical protein